MAKIIRPSKRKHGDSVFVMIGDKFTGTEGSSRGEISIVGRAPGSRPYLRIAPDARVGLTTVSSEKHLRALALAILKAIRPDRKRRSK